MTQQSPAKTGKRDYSTPAAANATTTLPAVLSANLILRYVVPVGRRTFSRWLSDGTFPRADISIGGKVRLWKLETVQAWIAERSEAGAR
jgi:predicted DNA-binding transcriptional regulator AlpA